MKVVFLSRAVYPFHGYGGMERYIYYLGTNIKKQDIELQIISSPAFQTSKKSEVYENVKFNFIGTPLNQHFYLSSW